MKELTTFLFRMTLGGALLGPMVASGASPVRSLLRENRLEEALPVCRQFEVLSTMDVENFMACAWVNLRLDRMESAERFMEKIRQSSVAAPEFKLLTIYQKLKMKQFDAARNELNEVSNELRGGPLNSEVQTLSAELYEVAGQVDTAAFIYKQVVGDNPDSGQAHWGLGRYYLARGDLGRAKLHLAKTALVWPKHVGSRYNLAVLFLQTDQLAEAARYLAQCYKLDRADPGVLEQLGLLFEKKGAVNEAIKYWRRAVQLSRDATIANEKLAFYVTQVLDSLLESGQYKQALAQIKSYGKSASRDPKIQLRRGIALRNLNNCGKAMVDLRAVRSAEPKNPTPLREMGICLVNGRQTAQAQTLFLKAVEMEPRNGLNHAWLAYTYEAQGRYPEAQGAWQSAVRLLKDPSELARARKRLALVARRLRKGGGESSEAQERVPAREKPASKKPAPFKRPSKPGRRDMWERGQESGAQVPQ